MGWVDKFVNDPIDAVTDNYFTSSPQGILAGASLLAGGAGLLGSLGDAAGAIEGATDAAGVAGAADPIAGIISGGEIGVADAAGPGMTFDALGEIIPNEIADSAVTSAAMNAVTDIPGLGEINAANAAAISEAVQNGTVASLPSSLQSIAQKAITNGLLGAVTNAAGGLIQGNAANKAGQAIGNTAIAAGNQIASAASQAAGIQSNAATGAASTLSNAATGSAQTLASGYQQAGSSQSQAAILAADTMAGAYNTAAGQQVQGYSNALGTANNVLAQQEANQKPYMQAGTQALSTLSAGLQPGGQFNRAFTMADAQNMAAYSFALDQGKQAINSAAAAGGTQLSSANLQSLGTFAEGTAAQYEQQAFNQWMSQNNLTLGALQQMVQTGQVSTAQVQQALAQYGVSAETLQSNIGSAQAAGTLGAGNATAQGYTQSMGYQAQGQLGAAQAQAAGQLGAAQAQAAGQVGSAGYQASGITQAAQAQAAGQVAATNATTAGQVAQSNQTSNAISGVANVLGKSGALNYLMGGGNATTPGAANNAYSLSDVLF